MDLRVLVLTSDASLGELIKAQIDNLGCASTMAADYDAAVSALGWADALIVDLENGLDDLHRLRVESPTTRIVAVAPDADLAEGARSAGAYSVLVEPFSIADVLEHIRGVGHGARMATIDLRGTEVGVAAASEDDKPWWATR